MAPICDSFDKCEDAKVNEGAAAVTSRTTTYICHSDAHDDEDAPFYGMFSSRDFDSESDWVRHTVSSPRTVIPEASETFLKVMKQLDVTDDAQKSSEKTDRSSCCGGARPKDSKVSTTASATSSATQKSGKSSKLVKKSASFSTSSSSSPSSSSSGKGSSKANADGSVRRMSVPCTRSEKHVQWADEAGVADLVSVRLIRPRISLSEKEEKHPSPVSSILRRLTGAN